MNKWILFLVVGILACGCKKESCTDGILNQNETAIDCGGACTACMSCSDGVLNQDEVETDCGGVCEPCPIYFPETGSYGTNILNEDSLNFNSGNYTLRAEIPEGSTFKVILYNVSGGGWGWILGTNTNCIISDPTSSQTFEAPEHGIMQVQISLGGSGTCYIQYFENSTSETKGKTITWS